jgi:SEFIR domain-containing protein
LRTDEAPTEGIGTMADAPRVFLSYSHDSDEHADRVLALADALCDLGIDVILDRYVHPAPAEGWPRWMDRNIDEAQFVLMVCTATYRRRVLGQEEPGKGIGVRWIGSLIYNRIYHDKPSGSRFIPILLLPDSEPAHIPNSVQGHAYYRLATFDLTDPGYEALYRYLTGQPATLKPELGTITILPPRPRPQAVPGPLPPSL